MDAGDNGSLICIIVGHETGTWHRHGAVISLKRVLNNIRTFPLYINVTFLTQLPAVRVAALPSTWERVPTLGGQRGCGSVSGPSHSSGSSPFPRGNSVDVGGGKYGIRDAHVMCGAVIVRYQLRC